GDFVRGYFDGDWCAYLGEHYAKDRGKMKWTFTTSFTCGCKSFLEELHITLATHGLVGGHIATKSRESGYALVFSRKDSVALYRLMYHTGKASCPCLLRKREKLERAIQVLGLDK
ncbi:MAG: hypothetical protein B7W98_02825, partial [Parcubacteria group bacterium 20-58-5]